jgi:hypothetical protein
MAKKKHKKRKKVGAKRKHHKKHKRIGAKRKHHKKRKRTGELVNVTHKVKRVGKKRKHHKKRKRVGKAGDGYPTYTTRKQLFKPRAIYKRISKAKKRKSHHRSMRGPNGFGGSYSEVMGSF